MAKNKNIPSGSGFNEVLLYTTPNGNVKVEIYLQNETIWLTQQKIADLFGVQRPAITKHLKNIFETGELKEEVVSSILEHTTPHGAIEGKTQETKVKYYNLYAIISVGYRVNSSQGKVSHDVALALAENEFEKYRIAQDQLLESDFDKVVKKLSLPKPEKKKKK
jgi:hypothetical protein